MSTISASTTSTTAFKVTSDTTGNLVLQTGSGPTTAVSIDTSQNVTFAGYANLPNTFGFKNRIINGAMMIDQRNAGASVTINSAAWTYVIDRWTFYGQSADGVYTVQRSTTAPAGFTNSALITVTTADASIGSTQLYLMRQPIEGFNTADLSWGTANAQTITISFWVRSSVTGNFGAYLMNDSGDRSYPFTFTINSANTFEQKSVTVVGDTTGTWGTGSGGSINLGFQIGAGSSRVGTAGAWAAAAYYGATGATNLIATNGATFYITGVQLEKGSTATSFDFRDYGRELIMCQRYYQQISKGNSTSSLLGTATYFSATRADGITFLPVSMRTTPSFSVVTGANYYRVYLAGNSYNCTTVSFNSASSDFSKVLYYNNTDLSAMTNGGGWWESQNASASIGLTAEL